MRTGITLGCAQENMYPETFFIIYHVLGAILRRSGFKDCLTYSEHNSLSFDQNMFNVGIVFNLFSEYGIGKSLEPLIEELFRNTTLNPEKHKNNIFFHEIVRLTPIVSNVIRNHDPEMEAVWLSNYSMCNSNIVDPISIERDIRLHNLLNYNNSYDNNSDDGSETETDLSSENSDYDIISDNEYSLPDSDEDNNKIVTIPERICNCLFCSEFRKYNQAHLINNINETINNVLTNIAQNINKKKLFD